MLPQQRCSKVILGLIVALLLALAGGSWSTVSASTPLQNGDGPDSVEISDPAICAECHTEEYELWHAGPHAQAFSKDTFQEAWNRAGRLDECLVCHTTGYDPVTGDTVTSDVTCRACHTTEGEKHPPAVMVVDLSSATCGDCHLNTYQEWQLSGHGQRGIECVNCHQSHAQTTRIEPADQLCHKCHGSRFEDLAHSSHADADLACVECHMPENPAAAVTKGIGSINMLGHTFSVGAQTCAQCHVDEVHGQAPDMVSEKAASLLTKLNRKDATRETLAVEAARDRVRILTSENDVLQSKLARQHVLTWVSGAFGLGIGIFAGIAGTLTIMFALQRRNTS